LPTDSEPFPLRRALITIVIVLLVVAMFVVQIQFRRDIAGAYARVETGSEVMETDCGPIEYARRGQGKPVLLAHGAGGGFDQGLDFGTDLTAQDLEIIAVSRFGYLRSPLPEDASPSAQADAYACLLDALDLPAVAMLGASAGTPSALQFALRHPERITSLVLLAPVAYQPHAEGALSVQPPDWVLLLSITALQSDFLMWAAQRTMAETLLQSLLATPAEHIDSVDLAERERVSMMLSHILPVRPRRHGLRNDGRILMSIEPYPLAEIAAPTLLISARDDGYGSYDIARYMQDQIPGAQMRALPDGGHLWVGHHRRVMDEIGQFVQAH
jgi:2-hydroxy-6-oxonona-2,4-dienedioate hydrolase